MTETFSCEILEENLKLKADNAALLARCDLLEAELAALKEAAFTLYYGGLLSPEMCKNIEGHTES